MDSTAPTRRLVARRPRHLRTFRLTAALLSMATLVGVFGASPSDAQSAIVNASVRTVPALPQPGQDVTVWVRVTGCQPGGTDVEALLAGNDQAGVQTTVMADAPAQTSLLWRTRARLLLHDAVQGWYGIRVQCGTYHPAQVPMANTSFVVGANPIATMSLSARTLVLGGTVTLQGNHCRGASVDYEVVGKDHNREQFAATASVPTGPDGSWSTPLTVSGPQFTPGPVIVRARCVQVNQLGTTVYVSYGTPLDLRIEPAP